ncbi:MAG: carbohydrate-binding domain-containing protein [Tyzzerella sp.]|nr:carbohydrate-binding domain-containing protein [Tyzzerella sp.]
MKKKIIAIFCVLMLVLSGCGKKDGTDTTDDNAGQSGESGTSTSGGTGEINVADMFTDRDYEVTYDESKSAIIQLNGDSAACDSDAVQISGTTVTIKDEGTYILRGTLDDGMVIVNADEKDKPQIVLDNVSINSETSAPIYILEADKVFITLAEGSTNTLSNSGTFTAIDDNNIDAAIFSKQDLTLNGNGSLTVSSPAGHGIVSKDDLVFTSGTYIVDSASHGLDANDSVRLTNATLTISSGKDGIHAENSDDTSLGFVYVANGTFDIAAEGDGISAGTVMQLDDGSFAIVSGGGSENATKQSSDSWGDFGGGRGGMGGDRGNMGSGRGGSQMNIGGTTGGSRMNNEGTSAGSLNIENASGTYSVTELSSGITNSSYAATAAATTTSDDSSTSIKGIKASGNLTINGGAFHINSADDAVHSNASVTINGGTFEIASGDDGVHADETLTVASGTINITESYEGLEGLQVKMSGGDIKLVASDDGLNAAGGTDSSGMGGPRGGDQFGGGSSSSSGSIEISGGTLYVQASGDGLDSNGTLTISGGATTVCGPTSGDTAVLDYDSSGTITGGTFIGTGATQMAQTFSSSKQGVIAVNAGNQSAGTKITVQDAKGNMLVSYEPELSFSLVIISSPEIESGETYTITVGSSSAEIEAD